MQHAGEQPELNQEDRLKSAILCSPTSQGVFTTTELRIRFRNGEFKRIADAATIERMCAQMQEKGLLMPERREDAAPVAMKRPRTEPSSAPSQPDRQDRSLRERSCVVKAYSKRRAMDLKGEPIAEQERNRLRVNISNFP